jgi:hypothetical protein
MAQAQSVTTVATVKRNSHGVLGGIAGAIFGFFVGLDLVLFGVVPFNSAVPFLLTVVGLVGGILWGHWAPMGRRRSKPAPAPAAPAPAAATPTEPAPEAPPEPPAV